MAAGAAGRARAGYDGVILGLPNRGHHVERTRHADGGTTTSSVFSLAGTAERDAIAARLRARRRAGRAGDAVLVRVDALAFEDPDGWRVVSSPAPTSDARRFRAARCG